MARVPQPDGRQHEELPAKEPPAPSLRRGRAVTSARNIVEEINEVHTRARAPLPSMAATSCAARDAAASPSFRYPSAAGACAAPGAAPPGSTSR